MSEREKFVIRTSFVSMPRALPGIPSRRDVLFSLLATGLGLGIARPDIAAAKKHHHKKRKPKAKPNAFGCLSVGQACKTADQCCSSICEGKKGKRKCRAHGTGTCDQQAEGICTAVNPKLTACDPSGMCACFTTTAGSNFCANNFVQDVCADCRTDADCEAAGFPAGSACLPFTQGNCVGACVEQNHMACLPPCGVDLPTT
jgi:hypothetical protein